MDTKTRWDNRKWQIQHNGCHFKGSKENGAEYICQPKILHQDSAASLREGVGGFLSSYPSPGSLQDLEVAGRGRYLFPKSPYTRSAIKELMGLSFSYTRKQKIWLSLTIITAAKSPLLHILRRATEPASVTARRLIAHGKAGAYCLINWKSWNIKVSCFSFMLKRHINCPLSPATALNKMLHAKCHVFTI